jgi:hypothetical protein
VKAKKSDGKKKGKPVILDKFFKEDTKQFCRYSRVKTVKIRDHPHMGEFELWKSLWATLQ